MKTGKKIILGLIIVLVIGLTLSCASKGATQTEERGLIERAFFTVIEGLTESTQEAREIQRQLTLEQQLAFLERHGNSTETDPGLQLVKEADGVRDKLAQILANINEHTRSVQEREAARRAAINEQTTSVNPYARARQ
jgi:hypothetical protein